MHPNHALLTNLPFLLLFCAINNTQCLHRWRVQPLKKPPTAHALGVFGLRDSEYWVDRNWLQIGGHLLTLNAQRFQHALVHQQLRLMRCVAHWENAHAIPLTCDILAENHDPILIRNAPHQ